MLPKFDGRRKYRSDTPSQKHLQEIFVYDPPSGNLWFNIRPRNHFKSDSDWNEWNEKFSEGCLEPDPSMNPAFPMRIPFYYSGEIRNCYAPEIVFAFVGVDYYHHWPIIYRDGNALNTRLINMKIVYPGHEEVDFGFLTEKRTPRSASYVGVFPKRNGQFEAREFHAAIDEPPPDEGNRIAEVFKGR